jgi:RNA polymerase primary sigma factor
MNAERPVVSMPSPSSNSKGAVVGERELVLAAQRHGGAARDALVETFMPLVVSLSRRYRGNPALNREELLQEGVVGLLRALERYDPELETPFWGSASWWVRQAMQQLVAEVTRPVVLSDRAARQLARVKHAQTDHVLAHRAEPTLAELAEESGLGTEQVQNLIAAAQCPRGLDEPLAADSGSSFGDLLADPGAEDAFDQVPTRVATFGLPRMLEVLDDRERTVVRSHYGLDGPEQTLRELGAILGLTAERVRQIECEALDKLRSVA